MQLSKLVLVLAVALAASAKLSERKWSEFFPEKQLHGLIPISADDDMFYWLFPSRQDADKDPLLIWLTGGPGCSSELALFAENGPMIIVDGEAQRYEQSWNNKANLVFIDQPIGTGYSKAGSITHIPRDEKTVAEHFGIFLLGFYAQYPEFKDRPLFISGESYAGHYIPFVADYILANPNKFAGNGVNLQGVAIGNGWVDPYNQYGAYAQFAFDNGLINAFAKTALDAGFAFCRILVENQVPVIDMVICNFLMQSVLGNPLDPRFNVYDIRRKCDHPPLCYDFSAVEKYLNRDDVRRELGVEGRAWTSCSQIVHTAMLLDFETNAAEDVAAILNKDLDVLVYNGDKDYICNWVGGAMWTDAVQWKYGEQFKNAPTKEIPSGTYKYFENFFFYRVYEAGHMVPMDQPKVGLEMIEHFIAQNQAKTAARKAAGHKVVSTA